MRAGSLDRKIYIQKPAGLSDTGIDLDAYGAAITEATAWQGDVMERDPWAYYATLRAEIVDRKADEKSADYGVSTEQWITFRTRYKAGILLGDRLIYEGMAYDIKQVTEIGRRKSLEIKALARGPQ